MGIDKYFGDRGFFARAADLYRDESHEHGLEIPQEVRADAKRIYPGDIAYCMGYAFAAVLHRDGATITDEDLQTIGKGKFPLGGPEPFVAGFKRFGA